MVGSVPMKTPMASMSPEATFEPKAVTVTPSVSAARPLEPDEPRYLVVEETTTVVVDPDGPVTTTSSLVTEWTIPVTTAHDWCVPPGPTGPRGQLP